jgi:hypothetical protein
VKLPFQAKFGSLPFDICTEVLTGLLLGLALTNNLQTPLPGIIAGLALACYAVPASIKSAQNKVSQYAKGVLIRLSVGIVGFIAGMAIHLWVK